MRVAALCAEVSKAQADTTAKLRENVVLERRLKELQKVMEEKENESEVKLAALQISLRDTRETRARCAKERERFHYVLACNGQTGSVPFSFLESDRDSLLYKLYGGNWNYARDEKGRALVTWHPERWAAVLEHLATRAVPAEWDPLLLAQVMNS